MKVINITPKIKKVISSAIKTAIDYERLTGRKLGITGEIGEVLVCDELKLKLLQNPLSEGYDAINNKKRKRYQIKTRRVTHNKGKIGKFSKHGFDYAVLVILDKNYKISELWQTDFKKLKPVIDRRRNHNPSFSEFKRISRKIK